MLLNILLGFFMIILTGLIHTLTTSYVLKRLQGKHLWGSRLRRIFVIDQIVLITILATFLEALLWSAIYIASGAIKPLEEALYFSIVTYTTLGYGDIVLNEDFRLLAAFEAANGVIMFGWSTAIVMTTLQKIRSIIHNET